MVEAEETLSDLKHILKDIVEKHQLSDHEFILKKSAGSGEGYIGVVNFVQIRGKSHGNPVCLDLVVKTPPKSQKLRECAPIRGSFLVENHHYARIHPKFREFQQKHQIDQPFDAMAKCFLTKNDEFLEGVALQDLNAIGYSMWNRKLVMDRNHVAFVMKNYGKLHAMSFALRHLDASSFQIIKDQHKNTNFVQLLSQSENLLTGMFNDLIKTYDADADKETIESLRKLMPGMIKYLTEFCVQEDEYSVISHGDCWSNNMMFQYEDAETPTKPTGMCFLDWQLSRISSPVIDASYFFYSCSNKECIDDLDHFLEVYHGSLVGHLKKFGLDAQEVFPFSKLLEHWKLYSKFGLIIAPPVVKIMLANKDEVSDMTTHAEKGGNVIDTFSFSVSNEDELYARIRTIVKHFRDRGFL